MKLISLACLFLLAVQCAAFSNSFTGRSVAPGVKSTSNMVMRTRLCDLTGARPNRKAMAVSFSHRRTHKVQHLNLQKKKFFSEGLKRNVTLRVCMRGLRTIKKYGVDEAAKKYEVDLSKFKY